MKLSKIDLSNIVAINHSQDKLGLLIDRGSEVEYLEIPAPRAAYQGLNQVANLANKISPLATPTLSDALNIPNQPKSVSYGASIEVDQLKKVVRVELSCELVYSLEESGDFEEEYDDFEDFDEDFHCEEQDY
ncbi:hypothetical protein [Gloeothece verrucosa]|nr:hypothetical protein [Gloeothece verrucosa]